MCWGANWFSGILDIVRLKMSSRQVQQSLQDILGYTDREEVDWGKGYLKKLVTTTTTLYNTSVSKIVLTPDEEVARCHICAVLAAERLAEKHIPDLKYYTDKIPLQPSRVNNLMGYFKQNLFNMSPVKDMSWTPSPMKRRTRSPVKNNDRFTAQDPQSLKKQLFGTPTKSTGSPSPFVVPQSPDKSNSNSPRKIRRKLAFEEDDDETDESLVPSNDSRSNSNNNLREDSETPSVIDSSSTAPVFGNVAITTPSKRVLDEDYKEDDESRESSVQTESSPRKRRLESPRKKNLLSLLEKRHVNISAADIIKICNTFELPKDVAFHVLEEYYARSSFLTYSWQLVAGLVINCVFIVFNERRRKDPRIDHLILTRMQKEMKSKDLSEVIESTKMVKELLEGQQWYRELEVKYNYFDGASYNEVLAKKLGSMLQPNNILATEDQYKNWSRRIREDISIREL